MANGISGKTGKAAGIGDKIETTYITCYVSPELKRGELKKAKLEYDSSKGIALREIMDKFKEGATIKAYPGGIETAKKIGQSINKLSKDKDKDEKEQ